MSRIHWDLIIISFCVVGLFTLGSMGYMSSLTEEQRNMFIQGARPVVVAGTVFWIGSILISVFLAHFNLMRNRIAMTLTLFGICVEIIAYLFPKPGTILFPGLDEYQQALVIAGIGLIFILGGLFLFDSKLNKES